jgi:3-methyladenine DNA glycosylase AlkD
MRRPNERLVRTAEELLEMLRKRGNPANRAGMQRFGIETSRALGVSMPDIRSLAAVTIKDHDLALSLWRTGWHEARILASLVDQPHWVTPQQMDEWVHDLDSWDLCDQVCGNLFDRCPHAQDKILEWARDDAEFVRRAAFSTIAWRAVHDKQAQEWEFLPYLDLIEDASADERNFVKKAVTWTPRKTSPFRPLRDSLYR